jgi:hypothetical protein
MATKGKKKSDREIRRDIMTKLTVPLWPHAGWAFNLGRSATYDAERAGKIKTIDDVGHKKPVPTAWLRKKLGLEEPRT